jgi:hypothetical protein
MRKFIKVDLPCSKSRITYDGTHMCERVSCKMLAEPVKHSCSHNGVVIKPYLLACTKDHDNVQRSMAGPDMIKGGSAIDDLKLLAAIVASANE